MVGALLGVARPAAGQPRVVVRTSPVADLVHQLDCVSGAILDCGAADYHELWRGRLLRDRADSAALAAWRGVRQRVQSRGGLALPGRDAVGAASAVPTPDQRWRAAALGATDFVDYRARLGALLAADERRRADRALEHFRLRFLVWWDLAARDRLAATRDSLTALLDGPALRPLLDAAWRFYDADTGAHARSHAGADSLAAAPGAPITVTLVARPGVRRRRTSAEMIGAVGRQEVMLDAVPSREVGVTLHEAAHALLARMPEPARRAVALQLGRAGLEGRAVRSLLDEGLATAFGNGLVLRRVRPPAWWAAYLARRQSFYDDPIIDAAGRALVAPLDSLLAAGATLADPRTVTALHAALAAALGPRLTSPRALLHDLWGVVDARVADAATVPRALQAALLPGNYVFTVAPVEQARLTPVERDPLLGVVLVAPAVALDALAARGLVPARDLPALRQAARRGPVLWGARRAGGGRSWLVVARSAAEARPLLERLAALDRDAEGLVPAAP